jgi:hypothetical protein
MTLKLYVEMGQGNSLCYLQIYTNLPMRNKTIPIPHLGCLLSRSRNSHNKKHAVAGYNTKIATFRKDPMVHEKEYLCYMKNLNCNGLVAVIGNYLISAHLYSTICGLQTLILGF